MRKTVLLWATLALTVAFGMALLVGCSSSEPAEPADDSTAAVDESAATEQEQEAAPEEEAAATEEVDYAPLSVSYLNKNFYEDIIVANNQGFYNDCGPEVSLMLVEGSGSDSVAAMLSGSVDVAATGQGPVADAIKEHGDDIVILAGANCWTGSQIWVAGPNMTGDMELVPYDKASDNKADVKASFENAAAVKGSPILIGVQQGATTENVLKSWLGAMEISFNDFGTEGDGTVTLVDVKANLLPTTLATGTDIDVMAASQPYPDTAMDTLEGSYRIGADEDINSYNVEFFITTKEIYAEKEDSIKAWLKADQETLDWMNANPEEAIKILAESEGCTEEEAGAIFEVADFNIALSDQMVTTLQKACNKKEVDVDEEQLKAQMPLYDWINGGMQ